MSIIVGVISHLLQSQCPLGVEVALDVADVRAVQGLLERYDLRYLAIEEAGAVATAQQELVHGVADLCAHATRECDSLLCGVVPVLEPVAVARCPTVENQGVYVVAGVECQ